MGPILTDSQIDTRIKIRILINVLVPKLEYAEAWEGNMNFAKLETVHTTAAKKVPRCSNVTSNTALRAELGMYPIETNRNVVGR